jgi:hypothetical protein
MRCATVGGAQHGIELPGVCQPGIAQQAVLLQGQLRPAGGHRLELQRGARVLLEAQAAGPGLEYGLADSPRWQFTLFKVALARQCKPLRLGGEEKGLHGRSFRKWLLPRLL